jgi:ribosomal protein S6
MAKYELMIIVSPKLTSDEQKSLIETIKPQMGEVTYNEEAGDRDLAYPIKGHAKAFYYVYNFVTESTSELDQTLRLYPGVLRHLIVALPEDYNPFSFTELDAGMEALRAEKATIREERHGGARKKKIEQKREQLRKEEASEKKEKVSESKPAPKVIEEKPNPTPAPKEVEEKQEQVKEAVPESEKKEQSSLEDLDKKLDKIFKEDDIDLGF